MGKDLREIQELLRHKNIRTTVRYTPRRLRADPGNRGGSQPGFGVKARESEATPCYELYLCLFFEWQSIEMTITADLFEAYLKCPMKRWLRAKQTSEAATGNAYSEWVERQVAAHRSKGIESLFATISETECAISVQKAALKTAKWWLAANVSVNAGKAESCLHALERIPSEGRGKSV
jgi:hypothetical protein